VLINLPTTVRLSFWRSNHLPVILQTETTACGLAVICMIVSFWGHRVDLPTLRKRFPISLKGATLKNIMTFGARLGLQARPLKLDISDLTRLKLPCILHWDFNHFVVLKSISRGGDYHS
jgi:ATP-binding cassette subfamily B protein RaxB